MKIDSCISDMLHFYACFFKDNYTFYFFSAREYIKLEGISIYCYGSSS